MARANGAGDGAEATSLVGRLVRHLDTAQQITHIGSWEWDLATNVVTWSDELYRIYGYEPGAHDITFEFFLSRLHPDDRERVRANVQEALGRGDRFGYPERIVRPDGSIRELDTVGEVVRDAAGAPLGLIGTCRDVTEERKRDETIRVYADIVRHMQIALTVWELDDPNDASSARLVACNPASEKIAHASIDHFLGKFLREIAPYARGGELERLIGDVAREARVREATVLRSRDPRVPNRALSMKAFPLPGRRVGVALEDITEATRAQRLRDAEQRVLESIASDVPLSDVLTMIVRAIEEHAPSTLASILLLDAEGKHVRHGAAPSLPESYMRAIDGSPIGPRAGSCGTAVYLHRPIYVEDIDVDPLWDDYRDLAKKHGLRACWSTPVLANDGHVLGTFALYYKEPRRPTADDERLIARATHLAGIAIARRQMEDQLRALSAHVESVREDERTGIAREIHDELGQSLTALKMDVAWIARRISSKEGEVPRDAIGDRLKTMSQMIDGVIDQVRRISAELRPGVLDDLGLVAALEWQAEEFQKRTGTTCIVHASIDDLPLERSISTGIFRIFQEALTNVARHANAQNVEVTLAHDGDWLQLEVRDDGRGVKPEEVYAPKSLGLLGIRERARALGGEARIEAEPSGGTIVTLRVPMKRGAT